MLSSPREESRKTSKYRRTRVGRSPLYRTRSIEALDTANREHPNDRGRQRTHLPSLPRRRSTLHPHYSSARISVNVPHFAWFGRGKFFSNRMSARHDCLVSRSNHRTPGIGRACLVDRKRDECRSLVRAEARFLTECPTHLLARFRANSLFICGSISTVIFITPTIGRDLATPALYQMLSGAIAVSALVLLAFARRWRLQRSVDSGC